MFKVVTYDCAVDGVANQVGLGSQSPSAIERWNDEEALVLYNCYSGKLYEAACRKSMRLKQYQGIGRHRRRLSDSKVIVQARRQGEIAEDCSSLTQYNLRSTREYQIARSLGGQVSVCLR